MPFLAKITTTEAILTWYPLEMKNLKKWKNKNIKMFKKKFNIYILYT